MFFRKRNNHHTLNASQQALNLENEQPLDLLTELEAKMDSMTEENFDSELVNIYLDILQKKDPVATDFDAQKSLAEFKDKHHLFFADDIHHQETRQPEKHEMSSKRFATAAVTATTVANVHEMNIMDKIIHWGKEIFEIGGKAQYSGIIMRSDSAGYDYISMADALEQNNLSSQMCPTWIPDGFAFNAIEVSNDVNDFIFVASYQADNGDSFVFTVEYWQDQSGSIAFEKDPEGYTYTHNQTDYYMMTNLGSSKVAWVDTHCAYGISGDISEEELLKMIQSIAER